MSERNCGKKHPLRFNWCTKETGHSGDHKDGTAPTDLRWPKDEDDDAPSGEGERDG